MELYSSKYILLALTILLIAGCRDKCDDPICFDVPTTYAFPNVSYTGQTERLDMLEEMTVYMKTGNTAGTVLDAQVLKDMYANENNPFSFTSSKQLKSKTFSLDTDMFENWMDNMALASKSTLAGSNGVAGVVESNSGGKQYLFDENGIEYTQLIEKVLMGAVFYYQASSVYLGEDKIGAGVDNETIIDGEGTDMEHHWDEAFGYLGVPMNFPANTDDARFHGKYCNSRDALMGTNDRIMDAFILGRAAISEKDMDIKDQQVPVIRQAWEDVIAATAIHYLNGGNADIADDALRNHQLSEAIAFTRSLKYNVSKRITETQIDQVLNLIGDNLYEVTSADLIAARDLLSSVYGLDSIKTQL